MKTILIIGGCGFIGGHLVEKLKETNNIIVLDNEYSGNHKFSKLFQRYSFNPNLY